MKLFVKFGFLKVSFGTDYPVVLNKDLPNQPRFAASSGHILTQTHILFLQNCSSFSSRFLKVNNIAEIGLNYSRRYSKVSYRHV